MSEGCVICGNITPYNINTSIYDRTGYIQGAGQLCSDCYKKVYQHPPL